MDGPYCVYVNVYLESLTKLTVCASQTAFVFLCQSNVFFFSFFGPEHCDST